MNISGNIVDIVAGVIYPGTLEVNNGIIVNIVKEIKKYDTYIIPGFIDSHVHSESSILVPSEFARLAVTHGTIGALCDPHEIGNVLGIEGIRYMMENADTTPFKFFFGAPSCVPATPFETSGACIGITETEILLNDNRIKYLAAFYPALSDMTGYLENRAGGWPHLFSANNLKLNNTKEKLQTVPYYDVVNFARLLKIPGYYSWGFNDETCPPTSMYSVYNVITAPRELMVVPETGHWTYPEQNEALSNWIMSRLQDGK